MWEWYWPRRLSLDLEAIDPFTPSEVTSQLELRLLHADEIDTPLYVFATGSTQGTVTAAAREVAGLSRINEAVYAADPAMTHLDVLFAPAEANLCLISLRDFLAQRS
jgi:hypothetical protein